MNYTHNHPINQYVEVCPRLQGREGEIKQTPSVLAKSAEVVLYLSLESFVWSKELE